MENTLSTVTSHQMRQVQTRNSTVTEGKIMFLSPWLEKQ